MPHFSFKMVSNRNIRVIWVMLVRAFGHLVRASRLKCARLFVRNLAYLGLSIESLKCEIRLILTWYNPLCKQIGIQGKSGISNLSASFAAFAASPACSIHFVLEQTIDSYSGYRYNQTVATHVAKTDHALSKNCITFREKQAYLIFYQKLHFK